MVLETSGSVLIYIYIYIYICKIYAIYLYYVAGIRAFKPVKAGVMADRLDSKIVVIVADC